MRKWFIFGALSALVIGLVASTPTGQADLPDPPVLTAQQIALATQATAMGNPSSTHEELPGLGHKFELIGVMNDDQDVHPANAADSNATNDTISDIATPGSFALAFRNLPPGIKITAFENQLGLKYYFEAPRSCFAGSPRVTLLVDANGDNKFVQLPTGPDFAAHGHVNPPAFAGCPMETWRYEDLTDALERWEVTPSTATSPPIGPIGGAGDVNWDGLEAAITAQFPNHKILAGFLVDDSCFAALLPSCGKAHYDLLTIENRTLENDQDTIKDNQ
jgi:hypothetical protein